MKKKVSVIIPCYNEERTIRMLLQAISRQTFPQNEIEVIIVDGMSTDGTRDEINAFIAGNSGLVIRIADNPKRIIPAGLNIGLHAAHGAIIIRLDAHSVPRETYIERCVAALESGKGDNVGGLWEIRPGNDSWIAKSIAIAASHPLGVGDARYRVGGAAQLVDTVPFGAFYREKALQIGGFDETLLTNEDYEFNTRIRKAGGKVWFDPAISSVYFARESIAKLAKQYWRYGFWKVRMLEKYPETLRWRQGLPPLFVLSLLLLGCLSFLSPVFAVFLLAEVVLYLVALVFTGFQIALRERKIFPLFGVPLAIAIMHVSWGTAFLWSMIKRIFKRVNTD